jgi:hypothetical protein
MTSNPSNLQLKPVESPESNFQRERETNLAFQWQFFLFLGLMIGLVLHGFSTFHPWQYLNLTGKIIEAASANTQTPQQNPQIPVSNFNGAPVPNWSQITFSNLPGISSSGVIELPDGKVRQWSEGQLPSEYLELGDFEEAFKLQRFNLATIEQLSGISLGSYSLADFALMEWQTVADLTEAIPSLLPLNVEQVPPLYDLFVQFLPTGFNPNMTVAEVLQQFPQAEFLSMGELNLANYNLLDIPGIDLATLENFHNWQDTLIGSVPGLDRVPFDQFPVSAAPFGSAVGKVDLVLQQPEGDRYRSISGGDQVGFNVPCDTDCAHIELEGTDKIQGIHWISGKFQDVEGGFGVLKALNNGKEPTGRHPFGKAFKVVVWETDAASGIMQQAMFFRICKRGIPDLGCSPYFIGPVPFLTYREMDSIFLGFPLNPPGGDGGSRPALSGAARSVTENSTQATSATPPTSPTLSNSTASSVELSAVAQALVAVDGISGQATGDYGAVTQTVCASNYCTSALGRYGLSSQQPEVRAAIQQAEGGTAVLSRLDAGEIVSEPELLAVFPQATQDQVFHAQLQTLLEITKGQTDPTTGRPFTGDRVIERMAQIYWGGVAVPPDAAIGTASSMTVQGYGTEVLTRYQRYRGRKRLE